MSVIDVLTYQPIDIPAILTSSNSPETGGIVLFCGVVRNNSTGKKVEYLHYEAYENMARKKITDIVTYAIKTWDLNFAVCIHRLGRIEISECAVLVVTGSSHRAQAYEANRYIIDKVKMDVPIWKMEYFIDGSSEWGKINT